MHGLNQKSNALQSLLGLFLQSAHTPYKVIDTLAHLGISVSTDTINLAIQSLSQESQNSLQRLGRSLLASYAYDNFDVDLWFDVPTCPWGYVGRPEVFGGSVEEVSIEPARR